MEYTVQELGKLAGVSSRTLRYYDEIGLLKPLRINSSGYRIYGQEQVDTLQQILFYRELGLGLSQIAKIVNDASFDKLEALTQHLAALKERQAQLHLLIENVKKTIQKEKGIRSMSDKEKFEGFKKGLIEENEEKYGEEIRGKYGDACVDQSNAKIMGLTPEGWDKLQSMGAEILSSLEKAVLEGADPTGDIGLKIAALHKEWLTFTWPQYSKEAHAGVAQMYLDDERFTAYYDKNVPGCARFLRDAVFSYTSVRPPGFEE